ncbi:hypothetical protein [Pararhizobium sp. PWRC1-1]|uniref:hypothetical protein n=1 Tax=Pararhizobium sp. PWRC1-1 TaxID=2804566 RepID=UPI003CFB124C
MRWAFDSAWPEEKVVVNADGTYDIVDSTIQGLLVEASKILEGNPKLEFANYGLGPKPIPGNGQAGFGQRAFGVTMPWSARGFRRDHTGERL